MEIVLIGRILRKLVNRRMGTFSFSFTHFPIFFSDMAGCEWGEAGKAVDRIPSERNEQKKNESSHHTIHLHSLRKKEPRAVIPIIVY